MSFLLSHPVFIFVFGGLIILSLTYTLYRLFPSRKTPKYIPSFICLVFEIYLVVHAFPFISRGWEGMGYLMFYSQALLALKSLNTNKTTVKTNTPLSRGAFVFNCQHKSCLETTQSSHRYHSVLIAPATIGPSKVHIGRSCHRQHLMDESEGTP